MITPERKHELAVEIAAQRANNALDLTPSAIVYRLISGLEDVAPFSENEKRHAADEIADLIRRSRAIVTFPEMYVGKGDGEPVSAPDDEQSAGSPAFFPESVPSAIPDLPGSIDNPEGWEDSWDRARAADEQRTEYEKRREGEDSAGRGVDESAGGTE